MHDDMNQAADLRPRQTRLLFFALLCCLGWPAALAAPVDPCLELIKNLAGISAADCRAAALKPTQARSVNGLTLWQRDVPASDPAASALKTIASLSGAANSALPPLKVLVLGGIHGDEMSSVALVFRWIALAQAQPAGIQWRFVPALNPDGLLQASPTRVNANKVDLNRNFPTPGWQTEAPEHWVQRTRKDPRRWPGNSAQSEPETRFVVQTMAQWRPDLIVSVHAPYAVLDFDGPVEAPHRLGKLFLDRVGVFPGSLGNYGGMQRNVPVVTLELPHAKRLPPDGDVKQMWGDLLRWTEAKLIATRLEPAKNAASTAPSTPPPAPAITEHDPAADAPAGIPEPAALPQPTLPLPALPLPAPEMPAPGSPPAAASEATNR